MKKRVFVIFLVCILYSFSAYAQSYQYSPLDIITKYYTALGENDWANYVEMESEYLQEMTKGSLNDPENKEHQKGLYNFKNVVVGDVYEFDQTNKYEYEFLLSNPSFVSHKLNYGENLKVFLVALRTEVHKENEFHRNGLDFHLVFMIQESSEWKILSSEGTSSPMIKYVYPPENRTTEINMVIELLDLRYKGFWANMNGDMIYVNMNAFERLSNFQKDNREYFNNFFSDINESAWYGVKHQGVIKSAYELKIIDGKSDGTFSPNAAITVSEALKMASMIHSIYNHGSRQFAQGTPWYQTYVEYAIENGIIDDNAFADYSRMITRAEMASIIMHALPEEALPSINCMMTVPDVSINDKYGYEIYILYRAGVLLGEEENRLYRPDDTLSRAEASAMVTRAANPMARKYIFLST